MRKQKRIDPMLLGIPSPSLGRLRKMNKEKLVIQIESLQRESMHILNKLDRLRPLNPQPAEKMDVLIDQLARLRALEKIARDRFTDKELRSQNYGGENPHSGRN